MKMHLPLLTLGVLLLAACSSSVEHTPEQHTAEFHIENAQRLYDGAHYQKALQQFNKAVELDDGNESAQLGRAWCLLKYSEVQVAQSDRKADDTLEMAETAFLQLLEDDHEENQFKIELGLGMVYVLYGNLYARRARLIESRVTDRGASSSETQAIQTSLAQRDAEYKKAQGYFKSVLVKKDIPAAKNNLTALLQLANIKVIQHDYPEALVYAERYLSEVERSKNRWVQATVRFPRDKQIWEAKLAGAVTKEVEVRDVIANILYKLGRLELAEKELTQVIFLSPERGDAYLGRGIVRDELGRKEDALGDYKEFMIRAARLDLYHDDPRVLKATQRIIELEKELGLPSSILKPAKVPAPAR